MKEKLVSYAIAFALDLIIAAILVFLILAICRPLIAN
jgi:hypothetical protein